jgi:hypothetical protein
MQSAIRYLGLGLSHFPGLLPNKIQGQVLPRKLRTSFSTYSAMQDVSNARTIETNDVSEIDESLAFSPLRIPVLLTRL